MRRRALRLLKQHAVVVVLGLAYAIWLKVTDLGIPCLIRSMTGYRCPGCGISHMCMELLEGHINAAFSCNRGVFVLLPVLLILWSRWVYRYIRWGNVKLKALDHFLLGLCIAVLLLWGIIRNLSVGQCFNI